MKIIFEIENKNIGSQKFFLEYLQKYRILNFYDLISNIDFRNLFISRLLNKKKMRLERKIIKDI